MDKLYMQHDTEVPCWIVHFFLIVCVFRWTMFSTDDSSTTM